MSTHKKIIFCLITLSFLVHMIGINKIGRTWDEQFKVDLGYIGINRLFAGDFSVDSWKDGIEHPMIGKYVYGLFLGPHLIPVYEGMNINLLPYSHQQRIQNRDFILTGLYDQLYAVSYDLTIPRMVSALFNTLAILITMLLGKYLLGEKWSFLPSIFLLFTPRFLVMGQLITYESLSVFLFSIITILYYSLLRSPQKTKLYIVIGILSGLLFWTRYNNVFIFPFLIGWSVIHYLYTKQIQFNFKVLLIPTIAFLVGFISWPLLWNEFPKYLFETFQQHESRGIGISLYFVKYLLVTTPLPIMASLVVGIIMAIKNHTYWSTFFLWWFFSTLVFFTLLSVPTGGTRYIIVVYPALAILAAYGYIELFKTKVQFILPVVLFVLLIGTMRIYPYYLDYYNILVGGTSGAAKKGYEISWWGEGQREVGKWINENLASGASVGLIVTPKYVFPPLRKDIMQVGYVDTNTTADYVVVSRSDHWRLSSEFTNSYKEAYSAKAEDTTLVTVWRKIQK